MPFSRSGFWVLGLLGALVMFFLVCGFPSHVKQDVRRDPSVSPSMIVDALAAAGLVHDGAVAAPDAQAVLQAIPATPGDSVATYDRAAFGPAWADSDRNGCDQRNDVLARDLTAVAFKVGTHDCVVLSGRLLDAYTGRTIAFIRGQDTSAAVQVDHVVPLSWAWQHGAAAWTPGMREQLATDLLNLQAVDGPTNESKSDQGPATWLPPATGYQCLYVTRFAYIVSIYKLSIDPADRGAMNNVLSTCR